jgi:hypothetical protein
MHPVPAKALTAVPEVYNQLQTQPSPKGVFDVVCPENAVWSAHDQVFHQRPIVGFGTTPMEHQYQATASELTRAQQRICRWGVNEKEPTLPLPHWFKKRNIRFLALHNSLLSQSSKDFLQKWEATYGVPVESIWRLRLYDLDQAPNNSGIDTAPQ